MNTTTGQKFYRSITIQTLDKTIVTSNDLKLGIVWAAKVVLQNHGLSVHVGTTELFEQILLIITPIIKICKEYHKVKLQLYLWQQYTAKLLFHQSLCCTVITPWVSGKLCIIRGQSLCMIAGVIKIYIHILVHILPCVLFFNLFLFL